LGTPQGGQLLFAYGTVTLCGRNFHNRSAKHWLCNSLEGLLPFRAGPTTPLQHHQQAVPLQRFRLIPFRSPLLRKSLLLSFPRGTEMFQFPRFPPLGLCVQPRVTGHLPLPGFPIRRSTDRSLVGGSPWLIAATHVLHRHLAPRHPPLALCSLESSRCSCSLCSSQGAGAHRRDRNPEGGTRSGALGHGEVLSTLRRRARRRKRAKPPRGGPAPFLQNGIVMTAEPRLGYGPSRRHIEAPPS
jgi:hypothetical protein